MKATVFSFAVVPVGGGKEQVYLYFNLDKALEKLLAYHNDDSFEVVCGIRPNTIEDFDELFTDEGKANIQEQNPENKVLVFRK